MGSLLPTRYSVNGKRGLASPDLADALALTFAYPVAPKGMAGKRSDMARKRREYNPFAGKR